MKKLQQDLKAVTTGLRALTKKAERVAKKVDKLEKAQAAAKRKTKAKIVKRAPAKKPIARKQASKLTATDQVIKILKRSKKGLDAPTLIKKTGFGERSVRNILYKASKGGKIKRTGRGIYVAA